MMMEVVVEEFWIRMVVKMLIIKLVMGLDKILFEVNVLLVVFLFSNWKVLFRKFSE